MGKAHSYMRLRWPGIVLAAMIILWVMTCTTCPRNNMNSLKKDEVVVFFPTYAHFDTARNMWEVPIHGWVYEPEYDSISRKLLIHTLAEALDLDDKENVESDIFEQRVHLFLVDNERGKRLSIRLGNEVYELDPSDTNGHFQGILWLTADRFEMLVQQSQNTRQELHFDLLVNEHETRVFSGRVHVLRPQGLSVISDIDDTIKISHVADVKELLRNTFLREFEAVPGMAEAYRNWSDEGADFHYISASPWQLYEPLEAFLEQSGFPSGTFHLKTFRLKDSSILNLFDSPEETKTDSIETLLEQFPERRFILVGDAGERDPEIYGTLARKYPYQIERIYIRGQQELSEEDTQRFREAFRDIPEDRWRIFTQADELSSN